MYLKTVLDYFLQILVEHKFLSEMAVEARLQCCLSHDSLVLITLAANARAVSDCENCCANICTRVLVVNIWD